VIDIDQLRGRWGAMGARSYENGSQFERASLAALGFGASPPVSVGTAAAAQRVAEEVHRRLAGAPVSCTRGTGGQWTLRSSTACCVIAIAWRSKDLRHPRPQGLPRALGLTRGSDRAESFNREIKRLATAFRRVIAPETRFASVDGAVVRRLCRDTNDHVVRWLRRYVAQEPSLVDRLWRHLTGGAYVQIVGYPHDCVVVDRTSLTPPRRVRLSSVDALRVVVTFDNEDKVQLRLHSAAGEIPLVGQVPLKYAVSSYVSSDVFSWTFEEDSGYPGSAIGSAESPGEGRSGRSRPECGSARIDRGDCLEAMVCATLQESYRVGGDEYTAEVQSRDLPLLTQLPAVQRRGIAAASRALLAWVKTRRHGQQVSSASSVIRVPDAAGQEGDNADVRVVAVGGASLGLSLKYNNDALKHPRPWTLVHQCGLPTESPEHASWQATLEAAIAPTEAIISGGRLDVLSRVQRDSLYGRVVTAAAEALEVWSGRWPDRVGMKLWQFLFGRTDTWTAICWDGYLEVRHFGAGGRRRRIASVEALGSNLVVQFDGGDTTRWRIHTASSRRGTGQFPLKWDVRVSSAPSRSELIPLT